MVFMSLVVVCIISRYISAKQKLISDIWQIYDKYLMYMWQIYLTEIFEQGDGCDVAVAGCKHMAGCPWCGGNFLTNHHLSNFPSPRHWGLWQSCDEAVSHQTTKTTPHIFQETTFRPSHISHLGLCGIKICLLPRFGFVRYGPSCISLILWSVFVCAAVIRDLLSIFS